MSYPSLCFLVTETFNLLLWLKEQKMKLEKSSSIQISIFPQSFQICSNLKQNHHPPPSESETKFHLNLFKSVHSLERSFLEKSSSIVTEQSLLDQGTFSETALVVNRFSDCRKNVRLTGFRCRCSDLFLSQHDCSYDYKAAGREAIVRENTVIRGVKIVKV
jgi:hypothetical protein